jgi:hypothetical protein
MCSRRDSLQIPVLGNTYMKLANGYAVCRKIRMTAVTVTAKAGSLKRWLQDPKGIRSPDMRVQGVCSSRVWRKEMGRPHLLGLVEQC